MNSLDNIKYIKINKIIFYIRKIIYHKLIIISFLLLFLLILLFKKQKYISFFEGYTLKGISKEELKAYSEYVNYCRKGIILYKENLFKSEHPKVSIIISLFNREEFINSTIKSVQNQKMKEIEIIIVDDYSTDNYLKYVEEAKKIDPRIILIKNKKNMATLYTKSIGALNASGEYLYLLDSDNMFGINDYLDTIYNEAKKNNSDIVECNAIYMDLINKIIHKYTPFWVVLWSKLIRTKFYQNIIYKIKFDILNQRIIALDDEFIGIFLIKSTSKISLNKTGVINFIYKGEHVYFRSFSNEKNAKKYCLNILNTMNVFYNLKMYIGRKKAYNLYNYLFKSGRCIKYVNKKIVSNLHKRFNISFKYIKK